MLIVLFKWNENTQAYVELFGDFHINTWSKEWGGVDEGGGGKGQGIVTNQLHWGGGGWRGRNNFQM